LRIAEGKQHMNEDIKQRLAIAERLRLAREQCGLTQGQVAKKLDWHRPTVSEIEAGRRRVAADEVGRLAELYGVDANWIIQGDETDADPAIQLAARVLSKLKKEDADKILKLLRRIPPSGGRT
jgi:transcriptional regulator with XRE-family HTH domain